MPFQWQHFLPRLKPFLTVRTLMMQRQSRLFSGTSDGQTERMAAGQTDWRRKRHGTITLPPSPRLAWMSSFTGRIHVRVFLLVRGSSLNGKLPIEPLTWSSGKVEVWHTSPQILNLFLCGSFLARGDEEGMKNHRLRSSQLVRFTRVSHPVTDADCVGTLHSPQGNNKDKWQFYGWTLRLSIMGNTARWHEGSTIPSFHNRDLTHCRIHCQKVDSEKLNIRKGFESSMSKTDVRNVCRLWTSSFAPLYLQKCRRDFLVCLPWFMTILNTLGFRHICPCRTFAKITHHLQYVPLHHHQFSVSCN